MYDSHSNKRARLELNGVSFAPERLLGPLDEALLMGHVLPSLSAKDRVQLRATCPAVCQVLDESQDALCIQPAVLQQVLMLERCERRAHLNAVTAATSGQGHASTAPATKQQHPYRTLDALKQWPSSAILNAKGSLPPGLVPLLVACGVEGGQMGLAQQLVRRLKWQAQVPEPRLACCSPQFVSRAELICHSAMLGHTPVEVAVRQLHALSKRVGLMAAPDCSQLRDAVTPLVQLATLLLYRRQFDHVEAIAQLLPPRSVTMAQVAVPLACALLLVGQLERAARTCLRYLPAPCGRDGIAMRIACALAEQPTPNYWLVSALEAHALGTYPPNQALQLHLPAQVERDDFAYEHGNANDVSQPWDSSALDADSDPAGPQAATTTTSSLDCYAPPAASADTAKAFRLRPVESLVTGMHGPCSGARNSLPACLAITSALLQGGERLSAMLAPLPSLGTYALGFVRRQLLPSLGLSAGTALAPGDARLVHLQQLRQAAISAGGRAAAVARELTLAVARALLLAGHAEEAGQAAANCDPTAWGDTVLQAFGASGEATAGCALTAAAAANPQDARTLPATLAVLRRLIPAAPGRAGRALPWLSVQHAAASAASPSEAEHAVAYTAACFRSSGILLPVRHEELASMVVASLVAAGQWQAALKFIQMAPTCLRQRSPSKSAAACEAKAKRLLSGAYEPVAKAAAADVLHGRTPEAGLAIALYLEHTRPGSGGVTGGRSSTPDAEDSDLLPALWACISARVARAWEDGLDGEDGGLEAAACGAEVAPRPEAEAVPRPEKGQQEKRAPALLRHWRSYPDAELAHQLWVAVAGHLPKRAASTLVDDDARALLSAACSSWHRLEAAVWCTGCPLAALFSSAMQLALHIVQSQPPSSRLVAFAAVVAVQALALPWASRFGDIVAAVLTACDAKPRRQWLGGLLLHDLAWCWRRRCGGLHQPGPLRECAMERVLQEEGHRLLSRAVLQSMDLRGLLASTARELGACSSPPAASAMLHALATGITAQSSPLAASAAPLLLRVATAPRAGRLESTCDELFRLCCKKPEVFPATPPASPGARGHDELAIWDDGWYGWDGFLARHMPMAVDAGVGDAHKGAENDEPESDDDDADGGAWSDDLESADGDALVLGLMQEHEHEFMQAAGFGG